MGNVTADIMQSAIKENKTTDDALNYIMDKYAHLIQPNTVIQNKQDKEAYKQKLIDEAKKKKAEQEKAELDRQKQLAIDRQKAMQEEKEKEAKSHLHKERVAKNRAKIAQK